MADVMNYIDRLVAELCPDGVDFYPIEELFTTRNGYTPSKSNSSYWENGTVPWFRMEDIRENGGVLSEAMQSVHESALKKGGMFPAGSIIVATSATIGEHALINVDFLCNQRFTVLTPKEEFKSLLLPKFLYYYSFVLDRWCLSNTTQSSFASVDMKRFKKFEFPVPPLEIQEAIVEILDKFTNLEAELEAELEVRRAQYEYYRNQLLSYDALASRGPVEWVKLGEVAIIATGKHNTSDAIENGIYPFYVRSQTPLSLNDYDFDEAAVITAGDGVGVGRVFHHVEGKYALHQRAYRIVPEQTRLSSLYLYHLMVSQFSDYLYSTVFKSSVTSLRKPMLERFPVALPTLQEQCRIADVLDRFDALVNDISSGLPAEIAARRTQYEYYRDRLLSFPEKK